MLGRAFALAGKTDSARLELNYVIQKNPKYKDAYIYLVNTETVACNYLQALEYADLGLKQFPNDRDLLLKKLDIYSKEGDWIESTKLADYLFERYSTDAYIRSVYLDYKLTLARQYSHRGYVEISKRAYEAVLEQDPLNKEALGAVFSLDVRSGNYESSLAYVNRALQSSPNSYEFLMKKVSILESMSRYVEAIGVIQKLMKLYPNNSDVQKLNIYMRMGGGRYYMATDPYVQFQAVLDKQPANREALNNVLNIAISRGLLAEALGWANNALKHYPNDRELLTKKMAILEDLKRYDAASVLAEKLYKNNPKLLSLS
jgi:cellulose synthase operon protein C